MRRPDPPNEQIHDRERDSAHPGVDVKKKGAASAFLRAGRGMFSLNNDQTESVSRPSDAVLSEGRALYLEGRSSNERIVNLHYKDLKFYSPGLITPSSMEKA